MILFALQIFRLNPSFSSSSSFAYVLTLSLLLLLWYATVFVGSVVVLVTVHALTHLETVVYTFQAVKQQRTMDYVNINEFNDAELATRMRSCNYEKFKSLVRMHLSFELDLNTDEFDLPCHEIVYEDKGKLKKWNRLSKKHRHGIGASVTTGCTATTTSKSVGNSPTETLQQQIDAGFMLHLQELKEFLLLEKNLTQEGLFRKTGSVSRQNELRLHIHNDKPLELSEGDYSAHDCATVFKGFLAELPEPLLTDAHYPAHLQIAPLCANGAVLPSTSSNLTHSTNEQHLLNSVQLLLLLLPDENRELLQHIIEMLHAVAEHERSNKMSAENLATLFTPHLICPRNLPPEVLHYTAKKMSSIIAYMIVRGMDIFEVPGKLATDIRAYFLERKRKKTMSPEQTLDESISDISTVNTVYTFVDRAATAAATNTNNTDTELAQLYAHIQSMPESSKKRRLIKQFNKQNGQGTPLQLVVMNRLKNNEATRGAKSLGDSIKKHIFHKSLMSRTPKRTTVMTPVGIETPNFSNTKQPKLRVLFQSPTPSTSTTNTTTSSTSCTSNTNQLTPNNIKTHPLQKSISSTSLLKLECSMSSSSNSSIANEFSNKTLSGSISAPVSRQHSHDLPDCSAAVGNVNNASAISDLQDLDNNCCVTPLKIMSAAAKQLMGGTAPGDKKTVAWDESRLLEIEEYSNPCTPIQQNAKDLKSRYKSEPNLSLTPLTRTAVGGGGVSGASKSLTRKLMKGVSMGNLRFPFSTPESTKRLVRSVSATLKRRPSDDAHVPLGIDAPLLEDVDDRDLDEHADDDDDDDHLYNTHIDTEEEDVTPENLDNDDDTLSEGVSILAAGAGSSSNELQTTVTTGYQHIMHASICRSMDLITSTPSLMLGRRSMSPITKSTQRMPKAMQESIMTPRSRKPVMVLTANSDPNQTLDQTVLSSFREQDEDDSIVVNKAKSELEPPVLHCEDATSLGGYSDILRRQHLQQANQSFMAQQQQMLNKVVESNSNSSESLTHKSSDALSSDFKEYLLTRSVLTASPVDSSFASQPDDFGGTGSTQEIEDFDESQLSPSLLYCLDGNEPAEDNMGSKPSTPLGANNTVMILNNARKRSATSDDNNTQLKASSALNMTTKSSVNDMRTKFENKENFNGYLMTKKLLISEYPGETSL